MTNVELSTEVMEFELGTTQHTADNRLAGSGPDVTARELQGEFVGVQQWLTRNQHNPRHRRQFGRTRSTELHDGQGLPGHQ